MPCKDRFLPYTCREAECGGIRTSTRSAHLSKQPPVKSKGLRAQHSDFLKSRVGRIDQNVVIPGGYGRWYLKQQVLAFSDKLVADGSEGMRGRENVPVLRQVFRMQGFHRYGIRHPDGHHKIIGRDGGQGKVNSHFRHGQRPVMGAVYQFDSRGIPPSTGEGSSFSGKGRTILIPDQAENFHA